MTTTTTPILTPTQAQAINAQIASRYADLAFAPAKTPNTSNNHQRGAKRSPRRRSIL